MQNNNTQQELIKYPVTNPKAFGPKAWFVLHNNAALYPDNPSRTDRMEYSRYLKFFVNHLPCVDPCRKDSYEYLNKNPPDFSNKENYFKWTVDFHNWVNEKTGNPNRYDYRDLLDRSNVNINNSSSSKPCSTCNYVSSDNHTHSDVATEQSVSNGVSEPEPKEVVNDSNSNTEYALKQNLQAFKDVTLQIVQDVCKQEGIPVPTIVFNKCPDNSNTSCITSNDNVIYLDPDSFSPKVIFHELDHYIDSVKNKLPIDDSYNPKAEEYANSMMNKYFEYDDAITKTDSRLTHYNYIAHAGKVKKGKLKKIKHRIKRRVKASAYNDDGTPVKENKNTQIQPAQAQAPLNPYQKIVHEVYSRPSAVVTTDPEAAILASSNGAMSSMPTFQKTLSEIEKEEMKEDIVERVNTNRRSTGGGILSHIDSVYRYPAQLLGVSAEELNLIHTPRILSNAVMTIIESYTSPAASIMIQLVFGIVLMVSGIFIKNKVPVRDVLFMEMLGALLFWDVSRNLNPKKIIDLKDEFGRIQDHMQSGRFSWRDLIETPQQYARFKKLALKARHNSEAVSAIPSSAVVGTPDKKGKFKHDRIIDTTPEQIHTYPDAGSEPLRPRDTNDYFPSSSSIFGSGNSQPTGVVSSVFDNMGSSGGTVSSIENPLGRGQGFTNRLRGYNRDRGFITTGESRVHENVLKLPPYHYSNSSVFY